jgi:hypothetical protein
VIEGESADDAEARAPAPAKQRLSHSLCQELEVEPEGRDPRRLLLVVARSALDVMARERASCLTRLTGRGEDEGVREAWHPTILVAPAAPRQFDHDDFERLVLVLVERTEIMADAIQIRVGYLYGNGVTDWTVVNFVLDETGRAAIQAVIESIISWGREWWQKRKDSPDAKPIKAVLYGPDGEILREVEVKPNDDTPEQS